MRSDLYILLVLAIIALAVIAVAVAYYMLLLRGHLAEYAEAVDKPYLVMDAEGFWQRLRARMLGWWTISLAAVAAFFQAVPALLDTYLPSVRDAPWGQVIDQKVAGWISFACVLLIPVVHAQSVAKAAATPPAND